MVSRFAKLKHWIISRGFIHLSSRSNQTQRKVPSLSDWKSIRTSNKLELHKQSPPSHGFAPPRSHERNAMQHHTGFKRLNAGMPPQICKVGYIDADESSPAAARVYI